MRKILEILFWLSLAAFLVCGALIVAGQLVGVIMASGNIITGANSTFSKAAFSLATFCAIFAFLLQYFPSVERQSQDNPETDM